MKKWIALIPAYEPTMLLLHLLSEIRCADFEAVVVDDGSGNSYSHIFEECSPFATVLKHSKNMGKGYALKSGFFYIQNHFHGNYIVVTLDCDGQHTVSDAKKICQTAQEYPDTLVLGSRKLQNHVPLRSRFGNAVTRLVYQIFTGLKIRDTQTGLRAFSNKLLLDFLNIPGDRYEYEMNVLLACSSRKIPIREVEIETIYLDNNSSSHFHALKDSCRIYREILKFSASSFISFLIDYILYTFLLFLTSESVSSLWISNIGARIISSGINYLLNISNNQTFRFLSMSKSL